MINTTKLNKYFKSEMNSPEMKDIVKQSVNDIMTGAIGNVATVTSSLQFQFLNDLGLINITKEESKTKMVKS